MVTTTGARHPLPDCCQNTAPARITRAACSNIIAARRIFEDLAGFPSGPLRAIPAVAQHLKILNEFPIPEDKKSEQTLTKLLEDKEKKAGLWANSKKETKPTSDGK